MPKELAESEKIDLRVSNPWCTYVLCSPQDIKESRVRQWCRDNCEWMRGYNADLPFVWVFNGDLSFTPRLEWRTAYFIILKEALRKESIRLQLMEDASG